MEQPIIPDLVIFNVGKLVTMCPGLSKEESELEKNLGIIRDGVIAVKNGKITAVGYENEILKSIKIGKNTKQIDAERKVVMPGFVDPHTHLVFEGTREKEFLMRQQGIPNARILKEENTGIISTVRWTRKAVFEKLLETSKMHLAELVNWGITTVEIKSGYGLNLEEEIKILKVAKYLKEYTYVNIKSTVLAAHIIPPEYHMRDEKYVDLVINDIIPIIAKNELADFNDVYCEKGAFTRNQAKRILKAGARNKLIPKIHADEMSDAGGAEVAASVNAISADHLVHASDENLKKMEEAGVIAVLLPITTFSLGSDVYADARKMIDMGLTVAIGTDYNPGTSMCTSMPLVISFAVAKLKMTIEEALYAATLNAAKAIDIDEEVGSLEIGKRANINILSIKKIEEMPYRIGENYVETVVSNGEILK